MTDPRDPVQRAAGAYLQEPWTPAQHRATKQRIEGRLQGETTNQLWGFPAWAVASAVCSLLALAGAWGASKLVANTSPMTVATTGASSAPLLATGSRLGSAEHAVLGSFRDGSVVRLPKASSATVLLEGATETRVELVSGSAVFEVSKQPPRRFFAVARGVEVRVVGTRFEVAIDAAGSVRVTVTSGAVEVKQGPAAGWSQLAAGSTLQIAPKAPEPVPEQVSKPVDSSPYPTAAASTDSVVKPAADSAGLFKAASTARSAGQVNKAVELYTELLQRFPGDERAGLAALELGRLRLDAQHDPARAAAAFRRAMSTAPNAGLREDASARLVEALDAMKRLDQCQAARAQYLTRYPSGVHAAVVRTRCVKR